MRYFYLVDSAGFVQCVAQGQEPPEPFGGTTVCEGDHYVDMTQRPQGAKLKWPELEWVQTRTLDQAKADKRAAINAARLAATFGSFWFQGNEIACDALSRSDIDGINGSVAINGVLPSTFPGAWKTKANTYIAVPDVATWRAFYDAMVCQGAANFAKSQQLKAQVEAAQTVAAVDAVPSWL